MLFSVDSLTSLTTLKPGSRIHVIGVCGVAMAQISMLLADHGYNVSGSDKEYFEPMSSLLKSSSVSCQLGYRTEHINKELDLVVIGNSVTSTNPEVLALQELGLGYTIFPKLLYEVLISGKHSIVVSGTHGKTTSSGMLSFVLESLNLGPSYFVGGKVSQLSSGLKLGAGSISVVEGDEYDSAFFAKFPKFHFYKPDTLIITSVEFDHADIYSSLEAIKLEFIRLISDMPRGSTIIACLDDAGVADVLSRIDRKDCNVITYGINSEAQSRIEFTKSEPESLAAVFPLMSKETVRLSLSIPGRYNLKNAVAAVLALESAHIPVTEKMIDALKDFVGVDRRQQVWIKSPLTLIEDFAHHPSAVMETLQGIREWLPNRRIITVFEPRSNTSRKKVFQADYVAAFQFTDLLIMKEVEARALDTSDDLFDVKVVCQEVSEKGVPAICLKEVKEIKEWVINNASQGDIIIVMSNGSFGGLIAQLAQELTQGHNH